MQTNQGGYTGGYTMTATEEPRLTTSASISSTVTSANPQQTQAMFHGQATGSSSVGQNLYYQGMPILGEQVVEHQVTVPSYREYEEVVEKIIRVPEVIKRKEAFEETRMVRERIIQVAQPVIKKKYVEEVQYVEVEKTVEVPQQVKKEKLVYVDKVEYKQNIIQVPKIIEVPKPVEVVHEVIKYVDVPKIVEQPETRIIEEIVKKPVPRIVEVEIPTIREVEVIEEVERTVPVPVEHIVHQTFNLPEIETEYEEVPLPVFVPAFTEVAVPAEYLTEEAIMQTETLKRKIAMAAASTLPSLCVIENLGGDARRIQDQLNTVDPETLKHRMADKVAKYHSQAAENEAAAAGKL